MAQHRPTSPKPLAADRGEKAAGLTLSESITLCNHYKTNRAIDRGTAGAHQHPSALPGAEQTPRVQAF